MAGRYLKALLQEGVSVPQWALSAAASSVAAYFATRAGRPPVAALPRLRYVQRSQLETALPWAAERLGLPLPPPLAGRQARA